LCNTESIITAAPCRNYILGCIHFWKCISLSRLQATNSQGWEQDSVATTQWHSLGTQSSRVFEQSADKRNVYYHPWRTCVVPHLPTSIPFNTYTSLPLWCPHCSLNTRLWWLPISVWVFHNCTLLWLYSVFSEWSSDISRFLSSFCKAHFGVSSSRVLLVHISIPYCISALCVLLHPLFCTCKNYAFWAELARVRGDS